MSGELKERMLGWKVKFPSKVKLHEGFSYRVAQEFPDNFFDFVYVDAGHGYREVAKDCNDWYPKVRALPDYEVANCGADMLCYELETTVLRQLVSFFWGMDYGIGNAVFGK